MDCTGLTDQDLVIKTLNSSDYFVCIIEKFAPRLRVFLRRLSGLADTELDDVMQDIYIKVYRNLAGFDPRLKLENWVYSIARNTLYDDFRLNNKHRTSLPLEANIEEEQNLINFLGEEARAEKHLIEQEDLDRIKRIIAALPLQMKEVAILRFLNDKNYEEMGDILKKPKGTVASLVGRARGEIVKRYNQEVGNG